MGLCAIVAVFFNMVEVVYLHQWGLHNEVLNLKCSVLCFVGIALPNKAVLDCLQLLFFS